MPEKLQFVKGNLVALSLTNFKGVRNLEVQFSPSINFLLAPNGHGKSSILEAIAICLGSASSDLHDLVFEGEAEAKIKLVIFDVPEHEIFVSISRGDVCTYFHNEVQVERSYLVKLSHKFKIFIDNPFVAMMQETAQKVMDSTPFERLKYLAEISQDVELHDESAEIRAIIERCEATAIKFERFEQRRNEFAKYANDFMIVEETNRLRKMIKEMEKYVLIDKILEVLQQKNDTALRKTECQKTCEKANTEYAKQQEAISAINSKIQLLNTQKEQQFLQFRALYNAIQSAEASLKRAQMELAAAQQEEKTLLQLVSPEVMEQKSQKEALIQRLQQQIQQLTQERQTLMQELQELQFADSDNSNNLLNTLEEEYSRARAEKQQFDYSIMRAESQVFADWYSFCRETQKSANGFMIFPAFIHIAINRLSVVPENDAKLMVMQIIGSDMYSVFCQNFDTTATLSKQFAQYEATSIITLPSYYFGKNYFEAYSLAEQKCEKFEEERLKLNKLKPYDVISCYNLLIGNYIVLEQLLPRLQLNYYIMYDQNRNDQLLTEEIDFIFKNNLFVEGIYCQNKYYRALKYEGRYNGYEVVQLTITQSNVQVAELLQVKALKEFMHEPILMQRYKKIELQYEEQEELLENVKEAAREKEQKISNIKQQNNALLIQQEGFQNQIDELKQELSRLKKVSQEDVQKCQTRLEEYKLAISEFYLKIITEAQKCLQMQVECADASIQFKELEVLLENSKMEAEREKEVLDEVEAELFTISDMINELEASMNSLCEEALKYEISVSNNESSMIDTLENQKKEFSHEIVESFSEEGKTKQEILEFYKKKLLIHISRQNVNIEEEQEKIVSSFTELCNNYNYIKENSLEIFSNFGSLKDNLIKFIGQLNIQFAKNMQNFGVAGELKLKEWKSSETANNKAYNEVIKQLEEVLSTNDMPEIPQELAQFLLQFDFDFEALERILRQFEPGVELQSKFAANEELEQVSLSGGEKSVVSLCLACCLRDIPLRIIDEINQGMDEHFENCANEMINKIPGQVLVSSPKMSSRINFDAVEGFNAIVLMRQPIE